MPIPQSATVFSQSMDPSDLVDFDIMPTQGGTGLELLQTGENVASFTLELSAEAVLAGLAIKTDGGYATTIDVANNILFWLNFPDTADRISSIFDDPGQAFGIELTITTTNVLPRRFQRTLVVRVVQK